MVRLYSGAVLALCFGDVVHVVHGENMRIPCIAVSRPSGNCLDVVDRISLRSSGA